MRSMACPGGHSSIIGTSSFPPAAEHRATEQMLVHLRGDVNMQTQQVGILKEELRTLRAAVHDRDKHLEDARRDLVERTADLVETRRVLVERTAMLEQMVAEVQALSQEESLSYILAVARLAWNHATDARIASASGVNLNSRWRLMSLRLVTVRRCWPSA